MTPASALQQAHMPPACSPPEVVLQHSQPQPGSAPVAPSLQCSSEHPLPERMSEQLSSTGLDLATLQLERLVEETHQALVRDGMIQGGEAGCGIAAPAVPSLDAVDRALEELQRGLAEIDSAIAMAA